MKIALIGYGKMGKMVEKAALSKGHHIAAICDSASPLTTNMIADADVCIDFTHPEAALNNLRIVAHAGKNLVMGTTGWLDHLDTAKRIVKEANVGFIYSPNFSLGIALFLKMISQAAQIISPFDQYDVGGMEIHHSQKADAPSGTAKSIGDALLAHMPHKQEVVYGLDARCRTPDQIHIASMRVGTVPGTHSVAFDSPVDTITLTHTARNREGFADGAITAAEWLQGKQGFFTLNDMMNIRLQK